MSLATLFADHVSVRKSEHGGLGRHQLRRASRSSPRSNVDVETGRIVVALVLRDHEARVGPLEQPVELQRHVPFWRLRMAGLRARDGHEAGNESNDREMGSIGGGARTRHVRPPSIFSDVAVQQRKQTDGTLTQITCQVYSRRRGEGRRGLWRRDRTCPYRESTD